VTARICPKGPEESSWEREAPHPDFETFNESAARAIHEDRTAGADDGKEVVSNANFEV
jgi:hypothetical protein